MHNLLTSQLAEKSLTVRRNAKGEQGFVIFRVHWCQTCTPEAKGIFHTFKNVREIPSFSFRFVIPLRLRNNNTKKLGLFPIKLSDQNSENTFLFYTMRVACPVNLKNLRVREHC
jgi:hypothetical protein